LRSGEDTANKEGVEGMNWEIGYLIGWIGILLGVAVPIPQLIKIIRTQRLKDISRGTYIFLVCALSCYLIHAVYIQSLVFIVAQSLNLTTNSIILILLIRNSMKRKYDYSRTD